MPKVIWRQEAIDDLTAIWNYTLQEWSEKQADNYYQTIQSACKEIENNPAIGKVYREVSKNLLGFKSGKHILFYHLVSENELEIIRILHERMDLESQTNE
ncbi:type II toxin-antitoxin system RelE/ParE family toxin [Fluviicola sp.]|uniref:type II toxin-antitoxin system RelE/ParE family toxin n=1 Tax=Fluviicola sp. TaxID=1917219 RepID=UPI0031DEE9CA